MKTSLTIILLVLTLLHAPIANAGTNAYPPENAALLYYKAIASYNPEDDINSLISDVAKGRAPITEDVIKHIEDNRYVINDLITAARIEKCNWAIDFSYGVETVLGHLGEIRGIVNLVLADARISASKGDYQTALERCIVTEKMAEHINGQVLINGLKSIMISSMADDCITYILGEMSLDKKELLKLKTQFKAFENRTERIKHCYADGNARTLSLLDLNSQNHLTLDMLSQLYNIPDDETQNNPIWQEFTKNIASTDRDFFKSTKDYCTALIDEYNKALDLPYVQAYDKVRKQIPARIRVDVKKKPEAMFAVLFFSAYGKVSFMSIRSQNSLNALKTAVEIYLVKAKTGKLPDKIPADSPKDLFSGKDFIYEKTETGFILRCRARDLSKDTIHEYEFKVAK